MKFVGQIGLSPLWICGDGCLVVEVVDFMYVAAHF
jgi:hypothetical protein